MHYAGLYKGLKIDDKNMTSFSHLTHCCNISFSCIFDIIDFVVLILDVDYKIFFILF